MNRSGIVTNSKLIPKTLSMQGKLPAGWKIVRFGDVVCDVKESEKNPLDAGLDRYIGLEHIEPENLHIKRWGDLNADQVSFTKRFRKGQVLFGKRRAYQRKVAIAEFNGICSSDILTFEPKGKDLIPELLPFIVQSDSFFDHALDTSSGSLSPRTRWSQLKEYEFPLPPKSEQHRIVKCLIAVDAMVEVWRNTISELEVLLTSLRRELFDQDQDKCEQTKMNQIGQWLSGGTPARSKVEYWGGNFPWVSPKDMKVGIIIDTQECLTELAFQNKAKIAPAGSILIVIRGMILAHSFPIAIAGRDVAFNQDMKALRVGDSHDTKYVFHWLKNHTKSLLNLVADSSHGTKRIPMQSLFDLYIPVPSLSRQKEVVTLLDRLEQQLVNIESHLDHAVDLRQGLVRHFLEH